MLYELFSQDCFVTGARAISLGSSSRLLRDNIIYTPGLRTRSIFKQVRVQVRVLRFNIFEFEFKFGATFSFLLYRKKFEVQY